MAKSRRFTPPFAWLGRHTVPVGIIVTTAIGAFFRFYELSSLPPGLDNGSATIGLQALNVLHHGTFPGLNAANDYSPMWVWMQTLAIKMFGATALALRIWPAVLGTLAVLVTWFWISSWFNHRLAWLTSFFVAITPWAVTVSRNGTQAAVWPFLVPLTIWCATVAWRKRSLLSSFLLGLVLGLNLLFGPVGWLLSFLTVIYGINLLWRTKRLFKPDRGRAISAILFAAGLALLGYLAGLSLPSLKSLPHMSGLAMNFGAFAMSFGKTLLMFNVSGDQNYQHNLAGEPMLNAFVGLMLVAGLLVSISRLHERRYRGLFWYLLLLLPAALSTTDAPNAAHAAAAIPIVLALAAVGVSYMLELWYQTFPINSAARITGQTAIIVLLALSLFQGYTQYFRAWAGTSAVYTAYNEGAVQMAAYLKTNPSPHATNVMVATPDELTVIAYMANGGPGYDAVQALGIASLPAGHSSHQFIISATERDASTKALKAKFPGGVLYPHYSMFNQAEIYYTYMVGQ